MSLPLLSVLTAASHALKSYAHGNASPALAESVAAAVDLAIAEFEDQTAATAATAEILSVTKDLLEQFGAYRNGWLGNGVWRDRIGLPDDIQRANLAIMKAEGRL